jgi:hypothetical protein
MREPVHGAEARPSRAASPIGRNPALLVTATSNLS